MTVGQLCLPAHVLSYSRMCLKLSFKQKANLPTVSGDFGKKVTRAVLAWLTMVGEEEGDSREVLFHSIAVKGWFWAARLL